MCSASSLKVQAFAAALLLSLDGCSAAPNRVVEETFERLYSVEDNVNVTIYNGDGSVLVYGSSANEVRLRAVKKAYNRARLDAIAIDVSANRGSVSITTRFPPKPTWGLFDRSGTVEYTIVVPETASISALHLDAGEILLDGMHGEITKAQLTDGRMFVRNCFNNFDVQIQRGNVAISYDWWENASFSAKAVIGRGNAWAYFPGDAAFNLVARSERGKLYSDFETDAAAVSRTGDGATLNAQVNGGGRASMKLNVFDGNIKIVRTNF